jgi:hypothetical protein
MFTYNEIVNLILKNAGCIECADHQQISHLSILKAPTRHKKMSQQITIKYSCLIKWHGVCHFNNRTSQHWHGYTLPYIWNM